jgi:UDP-N-acetyl-D-mannosaminuronate dehydrogenase
MPLHTLDLMKEALGGSVKGKKVHILGVSYLKDVGDTRHSPSEILWNALAKEGARVSCHDPLVMAWPELPEVKVEKNLYASLKGADAVVFAVGHKEYLKLEPARVVKATGKKPVIIDTQNLITDEQIRKYLKLGCRVRGVGKGHIRSL